MAISWTRKYTNISMMWTNITNKYPLFHLKQYWWLNQCKTVVSPLLSHWRYHNLAAIHQYDDLAQTFQLMTVHFNSLKGCDNFTRLYDLISTGPWHLIVSWAFSENHQGCDNFSTTRPSHLVASWAFSENHQPGHWMVTVCNVMSRHSFLENMTQCARTGPVSVRC